MSKKSGTLALWLMLAAMMATNALLLSQNFSMRREMERLQPRGLKAGESVPPFKAAGLQGDTIDVSYTGEGTRRVLFYFTPTCVFCRQQFPYWKDVLSRASGGGDFEVLGLVDEGQDPEKVREYLRAMGCGPDSNAPLRVALVSKEVRRHYKLDATPITVIVKNDGKVEEAWHGRWGKAEVEEAGTLLGFNISAR